MSSQTTPDSLVAIRSSLIAHQNTDECIRVLFLRTAVSLALVIVQSVLSNSHMRDLFQLAEDAGKRVLDVVQIVQAILHRSHTPPDFHHALLETLVDLLDEVRSYVQNRASSSLPLRCFASWKDKTKVTEYNEFMRTPLDPFLPIPSQPLIPDCDDFLMRSNARLSEGYTLPARFFPWLRSWPLLADDPISRSSRERVPVILT